MEESENILDPSGFEQGDFKPDISRGTRDSAKVEHTENIRAGISILTRDYGLHIDEYDYLDIAISHLRDIKNFSTTEYIAYLAVSDKGEAILPCNLDSIDAVMSSKMGLKAFGDRQIYKLNDAINDDYYNAVGVMDAIGFGFNTNAYDEGLTGLANNINSEGYLSYQLKGNTISVNRKTSGKTLAVAYTGLSVDAEGYPLINYKQANALAALTAKTVNLKKASKGDRNAMEMIQYFNSEAGRLKQAASIPEEITDNELDALLDAKTSFNRKTHRRPTNYSR